jgi:hypothetical protein
MERQTLSGKELLGKELLGKELSGKEFNEIYKDKTLVKLTNCEENHNGFQFRTGLNVDTVPFNPTGECNPGGIYFCESDYAFNWLNYRGMHMIYCRYVHVPEHSRVYIELGKFKADKLILTERKLVSDVMTEMMCLSTVKRNGMKLKYVKKQTETICLSAVKQNGLALEYVKDRTETICLEAVKQNGLALKYVLDQTENICLTAIKQNGLASMYRK